MGGLAGFGFGILGFLVSFLVVVGVGFGLGFSAFERISEVVIVC